MNEPQTLQGLLDVAMSTRGVTSGRRLAELAQSQGYPVTHTTVNAIRNRTYKSRPSDETLRAVAWLAGVPEAEAFAAAGVAVPGPPFADELPPGVDTLSPKARRAVIELLRVLVEEERARAAATLTTQGPVEHRGQVALAARPGVPAHRPDAVSGEGTQAPAGEWEPA